MADSGLGVQLKVRQNAEEIGEFMKDLDRWEADIKKKDEELISCKTVSKKDLPPIRNQNRKKKKPRAKKETIAKSTSREPKRISSYDYNAWDKFNVDDELKAIDDNEEMKTVTSSSSEDEEYREMIEQEQRLQRAVMEKDKGNDLFKEGKYEEAINRYTIASQLDPSNAIMPANRAMALLKVNRYGAAEEDCTLAINIDDKYTKAYLRRATARFHLNKLDEALADYKQVLQLEPGNRQAQQELEKLQKILNTNTNQDVKKEKENSEIKKTKVPLKRIHIEEIGSDSSDSEAEQTTPAHRITIDSQTTSPVEKENNKAKITEITADKPTTTEEDSSVENVQKLKEERRQNPKETTKITVSKPKEFGMPKSSMQLQADWKMLRNKPPQLFEYLKKINPKSYPKLFQQSIDSDMLTTIIQIFHDYYIKANLTVFKELQSLAQVQRFGMAVMFLSEDQKKVLQSLFSYVQENKDANGCTSESIENLKKKYGL